MSEKISNELSRSPKFEGVIFVEDVKEFIKKLKEKIKKVGGFNMDENIWLEGNIDKLAGEKLI